MVNAIQFYMHSYRVYWILLPKLGGPFVDLYCIVDNLMKDRTRKGKGVVNHSTPISSKMEDQIWQAGVLGKDTSNKLVETVLFLIGVNFALRGGDEHQRLRRPNCNPQIVNHKE